MPEINCYIPIKLRISGRVDDELLDRLERQLVPLIGARLALAERTLAEREAGSASGGSREIVREDFRPEANAAGGYQAPSYQGHGGPTTLPVVEAGRQQQQAEATQHEQEALRRIHDLLRTGRVFHRHARAPQAHEVLQLLKGLPPELLLEAVKAMRKSRDWNRLLRDSPPSDGDALTELEKSFDPAVGYIMPGDVLLIRLSVPEGDASSRFSAWLKSDHDVDVGQGGVRLPGLEHPAPIVGLLPQAAAQRIADTYVEAQVLPEVIVELGVRRRGSFYAGVNAPGQSQGPFDRPIMFSGAVRIDPVERRRREKLHEFLSFLTKIEADDTLENLYRKTRGVAEKEALEQQIEEKYAASRAFETWIEQRYAAPEFLARTPEEVWDWARHQATASASVTPLQRFLDFELVRLQELQDAPTAERATLQAAMDRYDAWLQRHRDDPDLRRFAPAEVWAHAYLQAVRVEVRETIARRQAEEEASRAERPPINSEAAGKKLDAVLELLKARVWKPQEPEILETPSMGIGYIVWESEEEKQARDEIARGFLHDMVQRITDDPNFTSTSVTDDFRRWLDEHGELRRKYELAWSHPTVEHFAVPLKIDVPAWQTALDFGIAVLPFVVPIVGEAVAVAYFGGQAVLGEDIRGNKLGLTDRAILGAGVLLPAAGRLFGGRGTVAASRLTRELRDLGLSERQAEAVYRATKPIAPGTTGEQLLKAAADDVRALKPVREPERLSKLEELFHQQGITDRTTLDALKSEGGTVTYESPPAETAKRETRTEAPSGNAPPQSGPTAAPRQPAAPAVVRVRGTAYQRLLDDLLEEYAGQPGLQRRYLGNLNALTDRQLDGLAALQRADEASGGLGGHNWFDVLDMPPGFRDDLLELIGDVHDVTRSGLAEAVARALRANPNDVQGALGHFYAARTLKARFPGATMEFEVNAPRREIDIVLRRNGRAIDVEVKTNLGGQPSINANQISKDLLRHVDDGWDDLIYLYAPQQAGEIGAVQQAMLRALRDPDVQAALARRGMSVAAAERILRARFTGSNPLVDIFSYH